MRGDRARRRGSGRRRGLAALPARRRRLSGRGERAGRAAPAQDFDERLAETDKEWDGFLETLQVETPDAAFDALVNHWLPYQSLACRIRARSAFYQASGAFGFRDQLQDTLALLAARSAAGPRADPERGPRQFPEGDVQHWWLPRTGAGVRTMISDDVVWLAYAVHRTCA